MELEEALRHAGRVNECDVEDRARQALPHYMFTYQRDKKKVGYCTNCLNDGIRIDEDRFIPDWAQHDPYEDGEAEYMHHPERLYGFAGPFSENMPFDLSGRHKHFGACPICGCTVQYRGLNMGRKALCDRIFLIQYRRSALDENALVMTGHLVICNWGKWDDYNERLPELYTDLREICIFEPGKAGQRFTKHVWFMGETDETGKLFSLPVGEWRHMKQCKSYFDPWGNGYMGGGTNTRFMLDEDTVGESLAGTWMEPVYAEMKDCGSLDRIDLMEALHRYPCIEYLHKLGFRTLARSLADGSLDKRVINTRGKTAQKVLKVDGDFYGWLKGNSIDATSNLLRLYHAARELKLRVGNEKLFRMSRSWGPETLTEICEYVGRENLEKTVNYILKKGLHAWEFIDHLKIMQDLAMDMRDRAMLWPGNFQETHTELSVRRKIKANEAKAEKLFKRVDALAGWWFSALGLTIRPFLTPAEIIREGNEMHHCVGGYVDSYLGGHTVLLALREDERPGKPWRTVEYTPKGQLVQCRGYRNKSPEDEQPRIDEFFRLFDAYRAEYERLNGKKKGRRAA